MNNIITDNTVTALKKYISDSLALIYDERERYTIVTELFRHFLNWNRSDLVLNQHERVTESMMLQFHFALKKLKAEEPLQYVLGQTHFHGHDFKVNPAVLIPRPETEELVRAILVKENRIAPAILDIGTGSGCIAISLKLGKPQARVVALDISEKALETAGENARVLNAEIQLLQMNILQEIPEEKFDIIVSNPPYIPNGDRHEMRSQVLKHEPWVALFVEDADPILFYRRIITISKKMLNPGGSLWFEIHEKMKQELMTLLQEQNIHKAQFMQDMQGKDRMLHIVFE